MSTLVGSGSTAPPANPSSPMDSAFSFSNFLPAGTVELVTEKHSSHCDHPNAEDGWRNFCDVQCMLGIVQQSCDELCRTLWFLVRHKFIAATYTILDELSLALVRIYLIPYDLANVQGSLSYRARKKEDLALARTFMSSLLPQIVQDQGLWEGGSSLSSSPRKFIESSPDRRTLPEIYSDLLSPKPSRTEGKSVINRMLDYTDDLEGLGIRSTLHRYQRQSVAAMLHKERSDKSNLPNPLYIPLTGLDGKVFYYQPGTTEILREQYMVSSTPGGVLCEELGTGKTVIILALIRSTINELSQPEESLFDARPILTPLAFRHFPFGEFAVSRYQVRRGKIRRGLKLHPLPSSNFEVPSLRDILLHLLCSKPDTNVPDTRALLEARNNVSDLIEQIPSIGDLRKANTPFYLHYQEEISGNRFSNRGVTSPGPKVMYLSSATLVVVPSNLVSQWDREIKKHCEEIPRVLIVRSRESFPSAKVLASDYDIVLTTYSRFTDEEKKKDIQKLHSWIVCKCPEFPGSRVPQCTCDIHEVSSLLQVRWKRLVIDEGHVSSTLRTRLTPFAKLLSVQSRWIVTGTPTTNLLGLSFGSSSSEIIDQKLDQDLMVLETPSEDENSEPTDVDSLFSAPGTPEPQDTRIWTAHDSKDIQNLLTMFTHFVGIKFLDDAVFKTHIKEALFDAKGPCPGAINMLERLMNLVMIRHRIKDVEEEVLLPKLTHEAIFLDLSPYMALSYNALQAAIAINAVDSQRTDQDYMFHRSNADALQLTMKNMSQLMFFSVDDKLYNAVELSGRSSDILDTAAKRNISPADMALAREALAHVHIAAQDALWRTIQTHEDIPYPVYNLPFSIFEAWSRFSVNSNSDVVKNETTGELMHTDRLLRLRETIVRRPLIGRTDLVDIGKQVAESDRVHRVLFEELQRKKEKGKPRASKSKQQIQNVGDLKSLNASRNAAASGTIKEMQQELRASLARLEALAQDEEGEPPSDPSHSPTIKIRPSTLLSSSQVADVRIGASASSKLNYIIDEVQKYSADEKFLIFSESELTLAHVAEALQLLQVKFLRFSTQVSALVREQLVLTFETSDTYRVFLMELKHGARGLNLVSASRVIFCEPVWQADVESQAIKRAHRIGQVRPVTVKTLAIRGTAEEKMIERREILKQTGDKIPKLLEETGMRHFIENPKFIYSTKQPENTSPQISFPLLRISTRECTVQNQPEISVAESTAEGASTTSKPMTPPHTPSRRRIRVEEPVNSSEAPVSSRPVKKRVVHFGV